MKHKFILLPLLCVSLLICSYVQAQQPEISPSEGTKIRKSLPIKFQRPNPATPYTSSDYFSFPIQFSSENVPIQIRLSASSTSAIFINNDVFPKRKGAPYKCSESKSCQGEETVDISWRDGYYTQYGQEVVVKEQVSFGGLTLPDLSVFLTNRFADHNPDEMRSDPSRLGLGFMRVHPNVPTLYESLKTEGLVDEAIVSMNLMDSYHGELIIGGYPANKTKADFKFVRVGDGGGYSVPINGIGYNDAVEGQRATLDFGSPKVSIPRWAYNKINDLVNDRGLEISYPPPKNIPWRHPDGERPVKCKAMDILKDLVVEFEGFTLSIPASAYIFRAKGFTADYDSEEVSTDEGCFMTLLPRDATDSEIILGQPFFKTYDVVFDSETNSVGFSPKYVTEPEPLRNFIPYILLTMGLASLVLFGFCFSSVAKNFRKPYVEFSGEGIKLDGSPPPCASASGNLPCQVQVGEPVQILPYQTGFHNYVNVNQSDQKIEN